MVAAYLDTSAFDHLYKKIGCTSADIANLRAKIYGRELSLPLGIHTLEEILLDRAARPELLVARIKLTLSLANFRRMVKPCTELLRDDFHSFAATGEAARPFIDASRQNIIAAGIAALVETDGEELDEEMIAALKEDARRKERFRAEMSDGLESLRQLAKPAAETSFEQYFAAEAPTLAERFAQGQGVLGACQQRGGIDTLLRLRSIRMMVGATLSLLYASTFEGQSPDRGDSVDLHHAVAAAAVAETFVTEDRQLGRILARVPMEGFEVVGLPAFLRRLS